jgi:RNA polymerase sigma factor (sigma-70 family)
MVPADAAALLRQWFTAHLRTVGRALAWFGVSNRDDRADLIQDVFFAAYLALLREEPIENPRAWLRECARKHASNFRHKELRRRPDVGAAGAAAASAVHDPERIAADRERLRRAFASLDEDAQGIVFDVRADEVSWSEVARERGITVAQARYLYQRALTQMEDVLKRDDSNEKERRSIGPPVTLTVTVAVGLDLIERALRAEADDVSPDTRRRLWDAVEQRMDATLVHTVDRGGADGSREAPASRLLPRAPAPGLELGATLGLLGGGIAIGVVIGYLLRGPLPRLTSPAPGLAPEASTLAPSAPPPQAPIAAIAATADTAPLPGPIAAPRLASSSPVERGVQPSFPAVSAPRGPSATARGKARSGAGSMALLDRARAAIAAGEALAALGLIAQHARRFPGGQDSGARRELLQLACAAPGAHTSPQCADVVSSAPPD